MATAKVPIFHERGANGIFIFNSESFSFHFCFVADVMLAAFGCFRASVGINTQFINLTNVTTESDKSKFALEKRRRIVAFSLSIYRRKLYFHSC